MSFCTVINCMDGRVQLPVVYFLQKRFAVKNVDSITWAGPNLILAKNQKKWLIKEFLNLLQISIKTHHSVALAIAAHHDCAGNPSSKELQIKHLKQSIKLLQPYYPNLEIIGIWVDEKLKVQEIK